MQTTIYALRGSVKNIMRTTRAEGLGRDGVDAQALGGNRLVGELNIPVVAGDRGQPYRAGPLKA